MVVFKDVRLYQCSTCEKWFEDSAATLFLTLYTFNNTPQNVGAFCSKKCKKGFTSKLFPKINNVMPRDHAC